MSIIKLFQPRDFVFSFSWLSLIFIFALACDKTNIKPDEDGEELLTDQTAIQQASRDLYRVIAEEQGPKNFTISPLSIQLALYMAYNGAEGETREEIGELLHVMDADLESLNQRVRQMQEYLTGLVEEGHLDIHNALFYDENRVAIAEAFVDRLSNYFSVYEGNLNFGDPRAVDAINGWVQEKTYDKIQQVLQEISDQEVLFLINALYLKADWVKGFAEEATNDRPFTTADGNEVNLPTMHQTGMIEHLTREGIVVVRLPLADSSLFVYLLMPEQGVNLDNVIESSLIGEIWNQGIDYEKTSVMFQMPVVENKTHITLNETLQELGMEQAFDPQRAALDPMGESKSGLPLYISRTLHDVYLKMDEKGVEGAAVTTIGVGVTSLPPSLQFNRPFMYMIVDQQFGLPLFMGQFTGLEGKD